jgi:hypothetical protein
MSQEVFNNPL